MTGRTWALVAIVACAGALRFGLAAATPLIYDEYRWLEIADRVSLDPPRLPLHGDQHPPAAAWLAALGSALLGPNLVGYRLASVVLGTAVVVFAWRLGASLSGPPAGLLAAGLAAANEYLLGVARLATEKCYLAFALAALLFYLRALETRRPRDFLAAGASFGLGLLTKESLLVWFPLFVWELWRREGRRALLWPGPWLGALAALAALALVLAWDLFLAGSSAHPTDRGLFWQLGRLGPGLSLGPLALYLRPLHYPAVEPVVSEYASMTALPGALILAGAALGLRSLRSPDARFLQRLGLAPIVAFSLLRGTTTRSEFWWADLSVVPCLVLTAALVGRLPRGRPLTALGLAAAMLPGAASLCAARDNCFPPAWPRVPPEALDRCRNSQRAFVARFRERDHAALTRLGPWRLPAAAFYAGSLEEYRHRLDTGAGLDGPPDGEGWPAIPTERRAAEREWALTEIARLSGP